MHRPMHRPMRWRMSPSGSSASPAIERLYEDNHLLVLNKPPGLATMGDPGRPTLHQWACQDIARRYNKPGKVFLGVVHRIDKPTTGVVVFARTSKAASRLSPQFARQGSGGTEKLYAALLRGQIDRSETWTDKLRKDDAARRMIIDRRGQDAQTDVTIVQSNSRATLCQMRLRTGRKHQIRVQSAARNHPILGEFKYAGDPPGSRLMLHAWQLTLEHPTQKVPITFTAPLPQDFQSAASQLKVWQPEAFPTPN